MIHLVTAANRSLFEDELLELRQIDCANSAHALAWMADGQTNIGHFDDNDAIHILAVEDGQVCGASRLTPTSKPHRLGDIFPHLAAMRGVPRDPAIYEWTQALPDPKSAGGAQPDVCHRHGVGAVTCAVVEYCLAEGIYALSGIIDARSLPRFHDMGWTAQPLGLPEQVGQQWMLATLMPIDASVLEATRTFYGIDEPVLMHQGPRPSITWEITS